MRTVVKAFAFSSAVAVTALTLLQPVADAALAPELPADIQVESGAPAIVELVAPFHGVNAILSAAMVDFPKPLAFNIAVPQMGLPNPALASLGMTPLDAAPPATEAQPEAPSVVPPAAQIDIPLPPSRPAYRALRQAAPRLDQVKFAGPTMPPFAHVKFCLANPAECRETARKVVFRGGPVKLTDAKRRELQAINLEVNRSIIATPATDETPSTEKWLISPQYGDCNDYAVTKRSQLIAKGWPARAVLLAEVVVPSGEHHLIVVVRTDKGDLVLDNLNSNLRSWSKTGYTWIRIESPENPKYWSKVTTPSTSVAAISRRDNGRL